MYVNLKFTWMMFWLFMATLMPFLWSAISFYGPTFITQNGWCSDASGVRIHFSCVFSCLLSIIFCVIMAFAPKNDWYKN